MGMIMPGSFADTTWMAGPKSGTSSNKRGMRGFTLVELLIVVVILGILAAVVIPQFSDASASTEESALRADLRIMRGAVQRYALEHDGNYPGSLTAIARYTNMGGAMAGNKTPVYKYGKYIPEIPRCPTGPSKGATGWAAIGNNPPTVASGSTSVGWLYHAASGGVWVNDLNHFDK